MRKRLKKAFSIVVVVLIGMALTVIPVNAQIDDVSNNILEVNPIEEMGDNINETQEPVSEEPTNKDIIGEETEQEIIDTEINIEDKEIPLENTGRGPYLIGTEPKPEPNPDSPYLAGEEPQEKPTGHAYPVGKEPIKKKTDGPYLDGEEPKPEPNPEGPYLEGEEPEPEPNPEGPYLDGEEPEPEPNPEGPTLVR